MHLLNTYAGVILPTSVKTFSIILLRQAYLGIPKELIESAKIDGAGELRTWATIMIPGIMPSISTIIIFDLLETGMHSYGQLLFCRIRKNIHWLQLCSI